MAWKSGAKKKATGARRRPAMRRKRGHYGTNDIVGKTLNPVPQRSIVKMKYSESVITGTDGLFTFNLNSVFDPNRTGVGHQPYGHDTFATLYNRYRVIAAGWRIQCLVPSAGSAVNVGCMPANEVLLFTTVSELRENPRARYITQSPGGGAMTLSGKSYIPSLVGRTKSQYMSDDRYQAQVGTNPQELAILNIITTGNTDLPIQATIQVVLEYTVEWFDVKHLNQS